MSLPAKPNPVSSELEQLLRERGMTHAELARRLGVSRPAVSRMLSPEYDAHSLPTLRRIADALGVQLEISFRKKDRVAATAPELQPPKGG